VSCQHLVKLSLPECQLLAGGDKNLGNLLLFQCMSTGSVSCPFLATMRINEKRATGAIELTVSLYLYTLTAAPRFFFFINFFGEPTEPTSLCKSWLTCELPGKIRKLHFLQLTLFALRCSSSYILVCHFFPKRKLSWL